MSCSETNNTAIAALMALMNQLQKMEITTQQDWAVKQQGLEALNLMLFPFSPHISLTLYHKLKPQGHFTQEHFPTPNMIPQEENAQIVLQVNGKKRDIFSLPAHLSPEEMTTYIEKNKDNFPCLHDFDISKIIAVPGRLINIVGAPISRKTKPILK